MKSDGSKIINTLTKAKNISKDFAIKASERGFDYDYGKWEIKKEYLIGKIKYFENLRSRFVHPKSVFISYAKGKGDFYYDSLVENFTNMGYSVFNGFTQSKKSPSGDIRDNVIQKIRDCTMYVGVLTKDHKVTIEDKMFWSPSIWTMEEKGIALGLGKPFVLIYEEGIHDHFWSKTTPSKRHICFEDRFDFSNRALEEACDLLNLKYNHFTEKYRKIDTRFRI